MEGAKEESSILGHNIKKSNPYLASFNAHDGIYKTLQPFTIRISSLISYKGSSPQEKKLNKYTVDASLITLPISFAL